MRLFFALWPDDKVRAQIAHQRDLLVQAHGGTSTRTEKFHLTLVFVDGVPAEDLSAFQSCGDGIEMPPFSLRIDTHGHFHHGLSWLGCSNPPDPLVHLQKTLQARVEQTLGYRFPDRFTPHITVARKGRDLPPPGAITSPIEWNVDKFVLVHSVLDPGKTRYDVLETWPLGRPNMTRE